MGWLSIRATSTRLVGLMAGDDACSRSWDPGPLEDLLTSFLRGRARQTWLIGKEEIEYQPRPRQKAKLTAYKACPASQKKSQKRDGAGSTALVLKAQAEG